MNIQEFEAVQFHELDTTFERLEDDLRNNVFGHKTAPSIGYASNFLDWTNALKKGFQEAKTQEESDKYAIALKMALYRNHNPAVEKITRAGYIAHAFERALYRLDVNELDAEDVLQESQDIAEDQTRLKTLKSKNAEKLKQFDDFAMKFKSEQNPELSIVDMPNKDLSAEERITKNTINMYQTRLKQINAVDAKDKENRKKAIAEAMAQLHQEPGYVDYAVMESLITQRSVIQQINAISSIRQNYFAQKETTWGTIREWVPSSIGTALGIPALVFAVVAVAPPVAVALAIGAAVPAVLDFVSRSYDHLNEHDEENFVQRLDAEMNPKKLSFDNNFKEIEFQSVPKTVVVKPKPEKSFWDKAKPWVLTGLAFAGLALAVVGLPGLVTVGAVPLAITGLALGVGAAVYMAGHKVVDLMKQRKIDSNIKQLESKFEQIEKENQLDPSIKIKIESTAVISKQLDQENDQNKVKDNLVAEHEKVRLAKEDQLVPCPVSPEPALSKELLENDESLSDKKSEIETNVSGYESANDDEDESEGDSEHPEAVNDEGSDDDREGVSNIPHRD